MTSYFFLNRSDISLKDTYMEWNVKSINKGSNALSGGNRAGGRATHLSALLDIHMGICISSISIYFAPVSDLT